MISKRQYILEWCTSLPAEHSGLTSYCMHPKVIEFSKMYYPGDDNERKIIGNLTSHFRRLVKDRVLQESVSLGLGPDSRSRFFGTTKQFSWKVNKGMAEKELEKYNKTGNLYQSPKG